MCSFLFITHSLSRSFPRYHMHEAHKNSIYFVFTFLLLLVAIGLALHIHLLTNIFLFVCLAEDISSHLFVRVCVIFSNEFHLLIKFFAEQHFALFDACCSFSFLFCNRFVDDCFYRLFVWYSFIAKNV